MLPKSWSSVSLVISTLLTTCLLGCIGEVRPTKIPLDTTWYRQGPEGTHTRLFVLLPGRSSRPDDFEKNGFVEAVRTRSMNYDLVAVDAHLGYYLENSTAQRLKEDVIDPAFRQGYEEIWLVGISLGSTGSLFYPMNCPDDISGILLLGPYLGERALIDEIRLSGGLEQWEPGEISDDDWQRKLWLYLQSYIRKEEKIPLYVAYGTSDPHAYGAELLGPFLPPDHELTTFGGHTWGPWKSLWDTFLDTIASAP